MTNPQSLNKYAYALNNPLRFTDPTGLYVCKDGQDCTAFEKSLDALRNSKNANVARAAAAYGALGDKNGVTVGFADLSKQGEDGKVVSTLGTDANGNLQAQSDVTISTKASGASFDAAIGHEGSHVADAQDVVKSIVVDPKTGDFTVGNSITRYQLEFTAITPMERCFPLSCTSYRALPQDTCSSLGPLARDVAISSGFRPKGQIIHRLGKRNERPASVQRSSMCPKCQLSTSGRVTH